MKYSAVILALAAGIAALPQEASNTITSAPTAAATAGLTPQQSCQIDCPAGDVNCQAACVGGAHPNSSQVVATNECAAKCDQGDGSPEDTEKYSECVQSCIASYFPTSQTVGGAPAGSGSPAASGASATGPAASGATGSAASQAASGTGADASGTATGTAAEASGTGAANANTVQLAGAGLAGLFMAMFAL